MKTLILAGGLGTRLRPLLWDRPKPMAPVAGKPFLEYQIDQLRNYGYKDVVLCIGHLGHYIQDHFKDGSDWGMRIEYVIETDLLDTAGAIKNAQDLISDTFLVLNGDSYLRVDYQRLVEFHQRRCLVDPRTIATMAIVAVASTTDYGEIQLNSDARLLRFEEKAETGPGWINGGIYVLEPDVLDFIPGARAASIEKETFPLILKQSRPIFGYPVRDFFVDIGTPEGYYRFCRYIGERT